MFGSRWLPGGGAGTLNVPTKRGCQFGEAIARGRRQILRFLRDIAQVIKFQRLVGTGFRA